MIFEGCWGVIGEWCVETARIGCASGSVDSDENTMIGLKEGRTGESYRWQTRTCVLATRDGQWWWLYSGLGLWRGFELGGRRKFL
jgi:hypothetical protein